MSNPYYETEAHAAEDLKLTTESDGDLYSQMTQPILKNLVTKIAQGKYNHDLAAVAFEHLAEEGAKKYAKSIGKPWHLVFPPSVRRKVAAEWRDEFEDEAKLGNYDNFLPKKYRK